VIDKIISKLVILIFISLFIITNVTAGISSESTTSDEWKTFGRHPNNSHYTNSYAPLNISLAPSITYSDLGLYGYYSGVISNNTYYFGENGGFFHALNASNISVVINKRSFDDMSLFPAIAGDSIYLGTNTVDIYQLNLSDTNQLFGTYAVPPSNGNAFYGATVFDGYLYASTGNNQYFYQFNATNISQMIADIYIPTRCYSQPAVANGYVYIVCNDGDIHQMNASNVSIRPARFDIGTGSSSYSSPVVTKDYVYVGSADNKVYQLNASNVSIVVNTYTTGGVVYGAAAVAHGYVYIGSNDKVFYQLNESNISIQVANYTGTGGFTDESAVTELYIFTSDNNNLYQFDAKDVSIMIGKVSSGYNLGSGPIIAGGYVYMNGGTSGKMTQYGTSSPTATINNPVDNFEFGDTSQSITFNCSGSDSLELANLSLYITDYHDSNFSLNQTSISGGTSNSTTWVLELSEGNYTWGCLIYDSDGNLDWGENRTMSHDTTSPTVTITTPTNNTFTTDTTLDINYTLVDQNLQSCWYNNDSMSVNTSLVGCANITSLTWASGQHTLIIWANDTKGNTGTSQVTFTIDLINPSLINITNQTVEYASAFGYNINSTDDLGVECFDVNDTTNFNINCTGFLKNNTLLDIGLYWINITVNDSTGNYNSSLMFVNVTDTSEPGFATISNQSIYDLDGLSYDIDATDQHNVSCFSVNDTTNFKINCTGFLENNTSLPIGLYWLNISVNDSSGNYNSTQIFVNVSLKPFLGLELIYPTSDINATQNEFFNFTVNVSCSRADCGEINLSLKTTYGNASDVRIAFLCYNSGCSDADGFSDYLIDEGFQVTQNRYTTWTDASLNSSAFDVIVVGGNYLVGYYAFDSAADPARDAFEDEGMPVVAALDYGYTPDRLGITTTTCTTDSSEDNILVTPGHNIMTGFSGTVAVDTSGDDTCSFTTSQLTDPYTKLFATEDAGNDRIAGFALDAGEATTGTNPGKFVYLGFDTADTYPTSTGNDSSIIKQAICWAATGNYDCKKTILINTTSGNTPFYTNTTNAYNVTLSNGSSALFTWWVNATGTANNYFEFYVNASMNSDTSINNNSIKLNVTILTSSAPPTITIDYPGNNVNYTVDVNTLDYIASDGDGLDNCWYSNNSGISWNSTPVSAGTNFTDVVSIEGSNNLTVFCNDTTGVMGSAVTNFFKDTILPVFSVVTNQSIEHGTNFGYDINATDSNDIGCFIVNDTTNFNINCTGYLSNNTALQVALYQLNITMNDTIGNYQSTTMLVNVTDTTAPEFITYANQTLEYDTVLGYDINATDSGNISCFTINDTTNFAINCTGYLTNNTTPYLGLHWLNLTINDTIGNKNSELMFVNITDTIAPALGTISNQTIEHGTNFGYDIDATDQHGVQCFRVNDTSNFNINCSGYLSNNTGLSNDLYWLNITVNDSSGNENSTLMWVNVTDTKPPLFNPISNQEVESSSAFGYDIDAYDSNGISCFTVNDTTNFAMNCSGYLSNNTALSAGLYWLNITVNDTIGNINYTSMSVNVVNDNTLPIIYLISPQNNSGDSDGNITFSYNVTDINNINNCSLYVANTINLTNLSTTKNLAQYFTLNNLAVGSYNWSIKCYDNSSNLGVSNTSTFSVVLTNNFISTNLSAVNITDVINLMLKDINYGTINFSESIDLSTGLDINSYVNISDNRIEINSTALPSLNISAELTFYNLTFSNPRLLIDDSVCPSSICTELSYSSNTLRFNVTHFTAYSAEETPVTATEDTTTSSGGGSMSGGHGSTFECFSDSDCNNQYCWKNKCNDLFDFSIEKDDLIIEQGSPLIINYLIDLLIDSEEQINIEFMLKKDNLTIISKTIDLKFNDSKKGEIDLLISTDIELGLYNLYILTDIEGHKEELSYIIEVKPVLLDSDALAKSDNGIGQEIEPVKEYAKFTYKNPFIYIMIAILIPFILFLYYAPPFYDIKQYLKKHDSTNLYSEYYNRLIIFINKFLQKLFTKDTFNKIPINYVSKKNIHILKNNILNYNFKEHFEVRKLKTHIHVHLRKGFSKRLISNELTNHNWSNHIVKKAFCAVEDEFFVVYMKELASIVGEKLAEESYVALKEYIIHLKSKGYKNKDIYIKLVDMGSPKVVIDKALRDIKKQKINSKDKLPSQYHSESEAHT